MAEVMLQAEKLNKFFGPTHALKDVSVTFYQGEIHGLIGENGSGKSTLSSMLTGIYPIDSGRFLLQGEELHVKNQVDANNHGVAIIVQEMGTLSGLTVAENIFLGNEDRFTKFGIKNTQAMNNEAQRLLEQYGFHHISAAAMIDRYNFEDRKLIEIVKSTYFDPKVLVVDETTTALSREGREELFKQMNRLRELGNTVIFISHDLDEVLKHTDRITILRDGNYIDTLNTGEATEDDLKKRMVGRELGDHYYRTDYGEAVSEEVVLSVSHVSVPGQLKDISFDLHRGEILGFGGLSECGMHEIGKAVFGASYDREGNVTLADGTLVNSISTAIQHSIAYASKDRDNESLVVNDSIRDNICLPSMPRLKSHGLLSGKKMAAFADRFANMIRVKMVNTDQFVASLSGGNKQKVVLARWIGRDSDIIVLDGPTRGIDIGVKADIYALMSDMKKQGKSMILISEEILELLGMSDRILVMKDGEISGEFLRSPELTEQQFIAKMV
ncbi:MULTISPECIES: sugar ABC transporter ATP-binding protein [Caproicibacterium]|uniref:Sugar ABC transporter ATP-binding protein n=1 Tax=Caproicibacterium argilliputei TaxID=3030016 RepID=A0AA97DCB5_9FIRM|nr:sugar ABC transporter ATP-binding protein [Caproicibacterium argilliputei]WOC33209.1 sugar ABC transporter ATP-binding protein [Caproicibacterium argilliputei]